MTTQSAQMSEFFLKLLILIIGILIKTLKILLWIDILLKKLILNTTKKSKTWFLIKKFCQFFFGWNVTPRLTWAKISKVRNAASFEIELLARLCLHSIRLWHDHALNLKYVKVIFIFLFLFLMHLTQSMRFDRVTSSCNISCIKIY